MSFQLLPLLFLALNPAPLSPLSAGGTGQGPDSDAVAKVMSEFSVDMAACYDHALERDPKARGTVALRLYVEDSGKVTKAESTGMTTLADREAVACVVDLAGKARFERQPNAVTVTYAVAFEPPPPDPPKP